MWKKKSYYGAFPLQQLLSYKEFDVKCLAVLPIQLKSSTQTKKPYVTDYAELH